MRTSSVALLCLLASLVLTASEPTSGTAQTQGAAVFAEIETTQTTHLADGNTLSRTVAARFYRDRAGRTRIEQGTTVSIADPVTRTAIMLDTGRRVATRLTFEPVSQQGTRRGAGAKTGQEREVTELGTKVVEGVEVVGKKYVLTIPAGSQLGNAKPIRRVSEVWTSEALKLPMYVSVSDPVGGTTVTAYKNVKMNWAPDERLFQIPAGFEVRDEKPSAN